MALFGEAADNGAGVRTGLRRPVRSKSAISPRDAVVRALEWLRHEAELRRSRRALLDLTDAQLQDIGVSRTAANREGHRSFYLD